VNGPFLNALGILLGALFGMIHRAPLSARDQQYFRAMLGGGIIFCGARLVLENLGSGFLVAVKKLLLTVLAVVLGYWVGKLLRLQTLSNQVGRVAGRWISTAQAHPPGKPLAGLTACFLLFGAAPLGWLGAVENGLTGQCSLFAIKTLMDALAMAGFVSLFGWPAALSAFPILALFGAVTWDCAKVVAPFLIVHHLMDSVVAATGLAALLVSVVIFEVRRVELANYLPAVLVAPVLEWLCG
jgi:uncharacterized membrane protein YqgA involved in biofilm formation